MTNNRLRQEEVDAANDLLVSYSRAFIELTPDDMPPTAPLMALTNLLASMIAVTAMTTRTDIDEGIALTQKHIAKIARTTIDAMRQGLLH
jgi:hypothetical protein